MLANEPQKIRTVLYALEMNEQCPPYFDYLTSPNDAKWTTIRQERLRPNDSIAVSIMVQHENDVYNRNANYQITKDGTVFITPTDSSSAILSSFDQCGLQTSFNDMNCKETETVMAATQLCSNEMIFIDDFERNSPLVNAERWTFDVSIRVTGFLDEEFVVFDGSQSTTFIENGILYIKPRVVYGRDIRKGTLDLGDKCTSKNEECVLVADKSRTFLPPISSAEISTKNSFRFKYGRVEIRAKLPKGDWIFPHIMLRPEDDNKPRVNIAFAVGNNAVIDTANEKIGGNFLSGGIIVWEDRQRMPAVITTNYTHEEHLGNDFHNYTLIWNKTDLKFEIDNIPYGTISQRLTDEYYIVLGVSVGGHVVFPDYPTTAKIKKPWQNRSQKAILNFWDNKNIWHDTWDGDEALEVDFIRVYAL